MIREVSHAVPFTFTAARGRVERIAFRAGSTHARIAVLADSEMECVHGDPDAIVAHPEFDPVVEDRDMPLFRHGGRLWVRADRLVADRMSSRNRLAHVKLPRIGHDGGPWHPSWMLRVPLTPDILDARGPAREPDLSTWGRRMHGGPAHLFHPHAPSMGTWQASIFSPVERDGTANYPGFRVVRDFGDEVSAAVTAFLEDEVRIAGHKLYLAWQGVHRLIEPAPPRKSSKRTPEFETTSPGALAWSCHHGFPVRVDRAGAIAWGIATCGLGHGTDEPHPLSPFSAEGFGDADVIAMANELPTRAWCWGGPRTRLFADGSLDALLPWVAMGCMGAIPPAELGDCLRACAGAFGAMVVDAPVKGAGRPDHAAIALDYIGRVALPVIERGPVAEGDDLLALEGL